MSSPSAGVRLRHALAAGLAAALILGACTAGGASVPDVIGQVVSDPAVDALDHIFNTFQVFG